MFSTTAKKSLPFLNEFHMEKYNMHSLTAKGKTVNAYKIYEPQVQSSTNLGLPSEYGHICTIRFC